MANGSDLDSQLWFACLDGDVEKAKQLIKDGADIEWKGQWPCSGLRSHITDIDLEGMASIGGTSYTLCRIGSHSPLSIAAYNSKTEVVRLLLSSGANVDAVDEHNRSALFWSAFHGSMTMTKVLLDYEADMNLLTKKSRSTVLMGATSTGRLDIVKLLVSRGASWKVANEDGLTALDIAKKDNHEHLIQYLSSLDDSESQMRKALTTDIKIKLKITRMSIHGAPGSGKTCLQHLILNEPPPLQRSSTGVVTPAVRGSTCGYMETDSSHSMKRVSEEEFITHLAKRLKGKEDAPSSKQRSSTYPPSTPPPTPPSRLSSLQRAFTSFLSRTSSESSDASSPLPDSPLPTHSVHYDIISQISTESCSEEDYRAHWTLCIDSGGQAAYQDIAPPFLRLNSLNIITL
ncbi:PREDICTED: ankyrin repeat domain-containing protein 50-like, partial [Amphimedon queenslandica]|uniref:Uncharacterized protein n=1 Tax=Amphimedon queenslandica TaxID=400682 RepID=A0AAN0JQZ0_AMPQE